MAKTFCAVDCFLLRYHLKVSNMSIVHGSDLYNIKSVHCVGEKVGLTEACTNGCYVAVMLHMHFSGLYLRKYVLCVY